MSRFRRVILIAGLAAVLTVATTVGAFARGGLSATVDRDALTTDDVLTLTIVVSSSAADAPKPQLPDLVGFTVAGSSTSSQLSIVNGAVSSSVAYSYRLQPYETGTLTIPAFTATIDGQTYTTDPITVAVSQGTGAATQAPGNGAGSLQAPAQLGNQDFFVEAEVDNPTPFVGEQITYTFRFYEAADSLFMPSLFMNQPSYSPPALTGFWSEGEIQNESYQVALNGRVYTVTELRSFLFPTAAGEQTIDPAQVTVPGFGLQPGGVLQSEPVRVDVQPLPTGAPAGFTGAVGQFDLQTELDVHETSLDEPIMATVTLSGWGNIGTAGDPVWPQSDGWRAFTDDAQVDTVVQNGRIGGTRVYEHTLIPIKVGELTLPAVAYSYFDPSAGEYRTLTTAAETVAVAPGPNGELASAAVGTNAPTDSAGASGEAATALQPMPLPATLTMAKAPLTNQPWYWAIWLMPLAALGTGFAWQQRQAYRLRNADAIRRSQAHKTAKRALARLPHSGDDATVARAGRILTDFLAVKLGRPIAGATAAELTAALSDRHVSATVIAEVTGTLAAMEARRYGMAGASGKGDVRVEIEGLIGKLDREL